MHALHIEPQHEATAVQVSRDSSRARVEHAYTTSWKQEWSGNPEGQCKFFFCFFAPIHCLLHLELVCHTVFTPKRSYISVRGKGRRSPGAAMCGINAHNRYAGQDTARVRDVALHRQQPRVARNLQNFRLQIAELIFASLGARSCIKYDARQMAALAET